MDSKKLAILMLLLIVISDVIWSLTLWIPVFETTDVIPLFGLGQGTTYLILWFLLPLFGGIIAVVLFPRIIAPLFLWFKKMYMGGYQDAYNPPEQTGFSASTFIRRFAYTYLLLIGFMTLAVKFIPASLLLTEFAVVNMPLGGEDPQTHIIFLTSAGGLLSALVVGLWSVGWSMESAGLIHFNLAEDSSVGLQELEPTHVRYNSYIKGYAGLSSILFVIGMIFSLYEVGRLINIIGVLTMPLHIVLMLAPAIYLHSKISSTWLQKKYPRAKSNMLQVTDLIDDVQE